MSSNTTNTSSAPQAGSESAAGKKFSLGIDLGTTTVKICIINANNLAIVYEKARKSNADISDLSDAYPGIAPTNFHGFSEQNVRQMWSIVNGLLREIDVKCMENVKAIGITGQQHGVVLWNNASCQAFNIGQEIPDNFLVSNLITWQDQRCSKEFLDSLPKPEPAQVVATGYGAPTILWLAKHAPDRLKNFDRSGTIMDFFATLLAGAQSVIMSPQDAETWGYFDRFKMTWNEKILKDAGFPVDLLPRILGTSPIVGPLRSAWHGISGTSVPISVAMGDLQCSFMATLQDDKDAVINFSTSSQVSFIRTRSDLPVPSSCDVRTYFGTGGIGHSGRELIVAPSLNGGNVLTFFVQTLVKWIESVGGRASESEIWSKIIPVANSVDWKTAQDPAVKPTLYGERYDVNIKASIGNITLGNVDLGGIVRGILKGVIENLDVMLPACYLRESGVTRIVLTGSLFRTFPQLTEHVVRVFGLPVVVKGDDAKDAAYGAALATSTTLCETIG